MPELAYLLSLRLKIAVQWVTIAEYQKTAVELTTVQGVTTKTFFCRNIKLVQSRPRTLLLFICSQGAPTFKNSH